MMKTVKSAIVLFAASCVFIFHGIAESGPSGTVVLDAGKGGGYSVNVVEFQMEFRELFRRAETASSASAAEMEYVAESMMNRLDYYDGRKFDAKRSIKKDSTYLLFVYAYLTKAYEKAGDCATAKLWFGKFGALAGRDYFVIGSGFDEAFDPIIDREVYLSRKGENLERLLGEVDLVGECIPSAEYERWRGFYKEYRGYMEFDNERMAAFRILRTNPDGAIKEAELMLGDANALPGHLYSFGRTYKPESSLPLWAYLTMINAYDRKKECKKSDDYAAMFKKIASGDYFVVKHHSELLLAPYTFSVYDPVADSNIYAAAKKDDLKTMRDYYKPEYNCFDVKEYNSLFQ